MIEHVQQRLAIGPAFLIGSSLGGLVAAHVAAGRLDVPSCVLMAPAFGFAARWQNSLGRERVARWRAGEPLMVDDHGGGEQLAVDYGFYEDAARIDVRWPPLAMPVLLMHGRNDEIVDIRGSRDFARQNKRVTLVELDDGHALTDSIPIMLPLTQRFLEP
jgi:pimeloyl-ACP methyl ester carboxylesterase